MSDRLAKILAEAHRLSPAELAELIAELSAARGAEKRVKWLPLRGSASYPMTGEDAQAWVSRSRAESDRDFHNGGRE